MLAKRACMCYNKKRQKLTRGVVMTATINTVTAICLVLLTIEVVYVIINTIAIKRPEKIAFIRSFKKGKCVAVFILSLPLFFLGHWYKGTNVFESILAAFADVVNLVVLKFSLSGVSGLIADNLFYKLTVYYCCLLVIINAYIFAVSVLGQRIWQWRQALATKHTDKDNLYILG